MSGAVIIEVAVSLILLLLLFAKLEDGLEEETEFCCDCVNDDVPELVLVDTGAFVVIVDGGTLEVVLASIIYLSLKQN